MNEGSSADAPVLRGRVALITGASRGIGEATARLFARHGAAVCINYFRSDAARRVVEAIEEEGGKALAVQADIRDQSQVQAMVQRVQEQLGAIDTLILNASGFGGVRPAPLLDQSLESIEEIWRVQMQALFYPCGAVVPSMIARKNGCIIAVSSNWSRLPFPQFGAISLAKGGVDAFVKSLAVELGEHGIRVNAVAPSLVVTDLNRAMPEEQKSAIAARTPLRRNAQAADIAGAILLLASPHAAFITGAYLPVSGGSYML